MNQESREYVRAVIHRILDDSAQPLIQRAALCTPGSSFSPEILEYLRDWEHRGYLKILRDPKHAGDHDPIIKMLSYIEQKSPIPGFLNWQ